MICSFSVFCWLSASLGGRAIPRPRNVKAVNLSVVRRFTKFICLRSIFQYLFFTAGKRKLGLGGARSVNGKYSLHILFSGKLRKRFQENAKKERKCPLV